MAGLSARVALALWGLALTTSVAGAPQNATLEYLPDGFQTVCSASWHPMALCEGPDPTTYGEYDIEVFRRASKLLGWVEGETYEFRCMGFSAMIADLTTPDGNCSIGIGGITISTEREAAGIRFSYPTYASSLAVMVTGKKAPPDPFYFLKPYTTDVWIAILLTTAAFPIIIFLIEALSKRGRVRRTDWAPGLKETTWHTAWTILVFDPLPVSSWAARVAAVCFGLMATVIINTWQANLAAFLTVNQIQTNFNSINDLRGRAVGTLEIYNERLAQAGISPSPLEFNGMESTKEWISKLQTGALTATAVDEPLQLYLRAVASTNCDLTVLPEVFSPFDYGVAFRQGTNISMVHAWDLTVLGMQEDGTLSALRQSYINIPSDDGCSMDSSSMDNSALHLAQMAGLWYILGGALALALLLLAIKLLRRRKVWYGQAARDAAAAEAGKRGGKGFVVGGGVSGMTSTPLESLVARVRDLCDCCEQLQTAAAAAGADLDHVNWTAVVGRFGEEAPAEVPRGDAHARKCTDVLPTTTTTT